MRSRSTNVAVRAWSPLIIASVLLVSASRTVAADRICLGKVPAAVESRCAVQYSLDNAQCRRLKKPDVRARCFESATNRLGACCLSRPLPPLIVL